MQINYKKLFSLSSVYALGNIATKGLAFLLLPLYTLYLMPEDYGIKSLVLTVTGVSAILLTFGLNGSSLRFYFKLDSESRKSFYGTLFVFFILFPGFILFLIEIGGKNLLDTFLMQVDYIPYLRIALLTAYVTVVFTVIPKEIFRASHNALLYAAHGITNFLLITGFTLWYVVFLKQGAEGAIKANFIGTLVAGLIFILFVFNQIRININFSLLKKALLYGFPLLPHFLSHWVLRASDKIILERYVSLADIGIYSVGYTIGMAMSVMAVSLNNSIIPVFGNLDKNNFVDIKKVSSMITYYTLLLTTIALIIIVFSKDFVVLLPDSYFKSIYIIPWVVLGYLFMGLYYIPMNILSLVIGETKYVGVCTVAVALLNIGLNLYFVPIYGTIAAAMTTTFSYF